MDPDIAAALRRQGIDATTTVEAGLRTLDDPFQLEFVRRERRVLVTDDMRLVSQLSGTMEHPGVVCCHRAAHTIGDVIRYLVLMNQVYDAADMGGARRVRLIWFCSGETDLISPRPRPVPAAAR